MPNFARFLGFVVIGIVTACASTATPAPEPPGEEPQAEVPREQPAREAPLRIGVIVSSTGSAILRQYADLVLEGVRVGADAASTARRAVELVVRDDGGTAAGAARALRELEAQGVRAVVGPLTDDALAAAARARSRDDLVLISPTAVTDPDAVFNAYALNVVDTRGAAALGEYARRYARVGVLYARTASARAQARAFTDAFARSGTVTEAPFDSGATTVSAQLRRVRDARVQALFITATERELQLILPQVDYFGLTGVQLFGDESWTSESARALPQRVLQGAIVAIPLWRESDDLAWQDFVARYESTYRRSLDNAIPALGYDAALLAVRAAGGGMPGDAFRGATGVLSLSGDSITRRPFLVRIDRGRLIPVN